MSKALDFNKLISRSKLYLKRSAPTILTIACSAGTIASVVMAIKATPKALTRIEEAEDEKGQPLTKFEIVNVAGPAYIPTALMGTSTIVCMFGLNVFNKKQQASLIGGYGLLRQSYQKYKDSSKEVYGDDAESRILKHVAQKTYISSDGNSLYDPDSDDAGDSVLFYDEYSSRYFTSTLAAVLNAQYHVNRNLSLRSSVSINEFYEFLGLDAVDSGEDFGWCMFDLAEDGIMWLDFNNSLTMIEERGLECYVISALISPDYITYE